MMGYDHVIMSPQTAEFVTFVKLLLDVGRFWVFRGNM